MKTKKRIVQRLTCVFSSDEKRIICSKDCVELFIVQIDNRILWKLKSYRILEVPCDVFPEWSVTQFLVFRIRSTSRHNTAHLFRWIEVLLGTKGVEIDSKGRDDKIIHGINSIPSTFPDDHVTGTFVESISWTTEQVQHSIWKRFPFHFVQDTCRGLISWLIIHPDSLVKCCKQVIHTLLVILLWRQDLRVDAGWVLKERCVTFEKEEEVKIR